MFWLEGNGEVRDVVLNIIVCEVMNCSFGHSPHYAL